MLIENSDLHWLSGLLEGEGSFLKGPPSTPRQPRISLTMTDEDIIQRVAALWNVKYHCAGKRRCLQNNWAPAWGVCLKGGRAVSLMKQLKPLMGRRRQLQIERAIASYESIPHPTTRLNENAVSEIKGLLKNRIAVKILAAQYNVNKSTIYQIKWGTNWAWVE